MDISREISSLITNIKDVPARLLDFIRTGSNSEFLNAIAVLALEPQFTTRVFVYLHPLAFDICARWTDAKLVPVLIAFARLLPAFPHLAECASQFLTQQAKLDLLEGIPTDSSSSSNRLGNVLLAIFRLLSFDNATFGRFIKPAKLQVLLLHHDQYIRYLAISILCQYVHMSDAVLEKMKVQYLLDQPSLGRWEDRTIDYHFLTLWEECREHDLVKLYESARSDLAQLQSQTIYRVISGEDLHPSVSEVAGVILPHHSAKFRDMHRLKTLILTQTTSRNLRKVAEALLNPAPLLLTGFTGSGKTSLINYAAKLLQRSSEMVTLHLNEQSDAKVLIGIYTTGDQPGSFIWQPGVLTTAVKEGRWVFIEDLDRAPNDIISTLLPLIESGELLIPGRGERIKAATGFKIIATMRSVYNKDGSVMTPGLTRIIGKRFWKIVSLELLSLDELQYIIMTQYPRVSGFIGRIMAVYTAILSASHRSSALVGTQQLQSRPISCRELFKWAERIDRTLEQCDVHNESDKIPESAIEAIFLDALESFIAHLEPGALRLQLIDEIAKELYISPQRRKYILQDRPINLRRKQSGPASPELLLVGRISVRRSTVTSRKRKETSFVLNRYSLGILEQVAQAVNHREPLLLVGETGIGKTAVIQHLSYTTEQEIIVLNLSQQTEAGDVLGGFKPVSLRSMVVPLKNEFDDLFDGIFSKDRNAKFLTQLNTAFSKSKWRRVVMLWRAALQSLVDQSANQDRAHERGAVNFEQQSKRRKLDHSKESAFLKAETLLKRLDTLETQLSRPSNTFRFLFGESNLVKAVRQGQWVLLDEINLAGPETLECLYDLLDSGSNARPFLMLAESGNLERIEAHPNFRLFAAMNPASDVGKKDLPLGIRSRFTEIYVGSPDKDSSSLKLIAQKFLDEIDQENRHNSLSNTVVDIYQTIQRLVEEEGLVDASSQKPHFSLRTLTRALSHAVAIASRCSVKQAVYEGFAMAFLTMLDPHSEARVRALVQTKLYRSIELAQVNLKRPLRIPPGPMRYIEVMFRVESMGAPEPVVERHWLPVGNEALKESDQYIITPYIARNLRNLIRAISGVRHPVLIQGPTSAGKTSMLQYLAERSGNHFVRINNHEHTDLQEYIGTYVSNNEGQLVFQEGLMVQALRNGSWVVLDELNLAPSDVLEALNRLLDDNRELLIPETQEVVKPHPNFMLFATQNPAGPYGGRKNLSRAFRNRFTELHFDDIPVDELKTILARRSRLPPSRCALIVEVHNRLSILRQEQRLFEQNSFATLRDLFRWALRGADSIEQLADNGYMLLAEKVRKAQERDAVRDIIETVMSVQGVKVKIDPSVMYSQRNCPEMALYGEDEFGVIWTSAMKRLYCLVAYAIRNQEPVLLVGETGCGKTTVCQMLAQAMKKPLHIVNAHQNTETSDLIGSQRPIRNREMIERELLTELHRWKRDFYAGEPLSEDVESLLSAFDRQSKTEISRLPLDLTEKIATNRTKRLALFEWKDGSLVDAMRRGEFYLLDEISLADDSVLERTNSVLDPQRSILLAEKGTEDSLVLAAEGFRFFATMNPGGDYGKKELSPALRNRFTEIWVPPLSDVEDVTLIVRAKLRSENQQFADSMVLFSKWFSDRYSSTVSSSISVRDVLSWVVFVNKSTLPLPESVFQGACLVYIDTLGANPSALVAIGSSTVESERLTCLGKLESLTGIPTLSMYGQTIEIKSTPRSFKIGSFAIAAKASSAENFNFRFEAPTSRQNALRICRALQINKPILLEGAPGVGKTSIVIALAEMSGKLLTRINLSEQTDIMDLFGSDVPVEDDVAGTFTWKDAPFLQVMKRGDWVLLDEMNLASQSVLEGLNACLDHRGEVYISELNETFSRHSDFRLFAAQNPHHQGGGRKGLPASFVNRFTVVYADVYKQTDLETICSHLQWPRTLPDQWREMIAFVSDLDKQVGAQRVFGMNGSPWEFNLRDIMRWFRLLTSIAGFLPAGRAEDFMNLLFSQRFRSKSDTLCLSKLYDSHFVGTHSLSNCHVQLSPRMIQVGLSVIERNALVVYTRPPRTTRLLGNLPTFKSLMLCVQQNWPVILVGSSGSGKTTILQKLAAALGANLETFALHADIDATDLVGGFEQADPFRDIQSLLIRLSNFCRSHIAQHFQDSNVSLGFEDDLRYLLDMLSIAEEGTEPREQLQLSLPLLKLYSDHCPSASAKDILVTGLGMLKNSGDVQLAKFKWIDGILVRALEEGKWLILDNANLCNSSVLDRLNSLLEPNGALIVNEHCNEDGSPKTVQAHPNFRIFMTMDPQHGEMSRAMRNRAVELYLPFRSDDHAGFDFSPSLSESCMGSLRQFLHTCTTLKLEDEAQYAQEVVTLGLESLSFEEFKLIPRLMHQSTIALIPAQIQQFVRVAFDRCKMTFSKEINWEGPIMDMYRIVARRTDSFEDEASFQPIHPLANTQLALYTDTFSLQQKPTSLAYLLDITYCLVDMRVKLQSARASISPVNLVTRLQRSFAANSIRSARRDSTRSIASFLEQVVQSLAAWLQTKQSEPDITQSTFHSVINTTRFWWHLYESVDTENFNESVYQICISLWRESIGDVAATDSSSAPYIQSITRHLHYLSSEVASASGYWNDAIWSAFRPVVPRSYDSYLVSGTLKSLMTRFKIQAWTMRAPPSEKVALYKSLQEGYNNVVIYGWDAKQLIQDIESTLKNLAVGNTQQAVAPFYSTIFHGISKLYSITTSAKDRSELLQLLADGDIWPVFRRLYLSDVGYQLATTTACFQNDMILDDKVVYEDQLAFAIAQKTSQIGETGLKMLQLLQIELDEIGHLVANDMNRFATGVIDTLIGNICTLAENISDLRNRLSNQDTSENAIKMGNTIRQIVGLLRPLAPDFLRKREACIAAGSHIIALGCTCVQLFVTDRPYDPLLRSHVQKMNYEKHKLQLETRLRAFSVFEKSHLGDATSLRRKIYKEELAQLGIAPIAVEVARPPNSRLSDLQVEFDAVLHLVNEMQSYQVMEEIEPAGRGRLLESLTIIIRRLQDGFADYLDLIQPAISFVRLIKMGIVLLDRAATVGEAVSPTQSYEHPATVQYLPLCGLPLARLDAIKAVKGLHFGSSLGSYRLIASISPTSKWPQTTFDRLIGEFDRLHGRWKLQLERNQKKRDAEASLYRYKGGAEEDEQNTEKDFEDLFPSYEIEQKEKMLESDEIFLQQSAQLAADSHVAIFLHPKEAELILEEILSNILPTNANAGSARNQDILPLVMLQLDQKKDQFQNLRQSSLTYNIYADVNIPEMQKLIRIISEVQDRFTSLVEAWPEHSTLHDVLNTCQDLLSFAHTEPLMKVLSKVEKLHAYIYEWQTVASREFTAAHQLDLITDLIISWRQLELSTWFKLLDIEDVKVADQAKEFFFLAYGNVTLPGMVDHAEQLLEVLQSLLLSSTKGQYQHRLRMLRSFVQQLEIGFYYRATESEVKDVSVVLRNFCNYYARFEGIVLKSIAKDRQTLERKVKEVCLLASWKDRNIVSLRQSAQTSHRKLFRVIKKYREALAQPVSPLISEELPIETSDQEISDSFNKVAISEITNDVLEICQRNEALWGPRPLRFKNVSNTRSMVELKLSENDENDHVTFRLQSFLESINASINILRKATPSILTEDNAADVKHLATRKRLLFTDTLKDLRQMGFKSALTPNVLRRQSSLTATLSSMSSFPQALFSITAAQQGDNLIHQILDLMEKVRQAAKNPHEDITRAQIARCIGLTESMLATCLNQRDLIASTSRSLFEIGELVSKTEALRTSGACAVSELGQAFISKSQCMETKVHWLPTIMRVAAKIIAAQSRLGSLDFQEPIHGLQELATDFENLLNKLKSLPTPVGLAHLEKISWTQRVHDHAAKSLETLHTWIRKYPQIKITLEHILQWTVGEPEEASTSSEAESDIVDPADFELAQYRLLDSILGSVQDIEKVSKSQEGVDPDKSWVIRYSELQVSKLNSFHAGLITNMLEKLLSNLFKVEKQNPEALNFATASLTIALPLVQQYQQGLQLYLNRFLNLHRSTCRLSYNMTKAFATLASEGFCKPSEKSTEKSTGNEKLESGIGLGDGEGAEDISKDIEDDEDLSELAQDPGNQKSESGIENEDDAVNIEDALEGTAGENMKNGETEEIEDKPEHDLEKEEDANSETGSIGGGEGGAQEDDGEAVEEETGDVDDLGPSAVDEKMWDQADSDDKNAKEAKQSAENENGDENATSGEKGHSISDLESKDAQEDGLSEADSDVSMSNTDGNDAGLQEEQGLDPHIQESEGLELPDDMQLDGDKGGHDDDEDGEHDLDLEDEEKATEALDGDDQNLNDEDTNDATDETTEHLDKGKVDLDDDDSMSGKEEQDSQDDQAEATNNQDNTNGIGDDDPESKERTNGVSTGQAEQDEHGSDNEEVVGAGVDQTLEERKSSKANAQQQSGEQSDSADTTRAPMSQSKGAKPGVSNQEIHDREAIKQLGDILKKWHRQQQEIRPASESDIDTETSQQQEDQDMTGVDFEHLPNETADADAQALGAASDEQARALDESLANDIDNKNEVHLPETIRPDDQNHHMTDSEEDDIEMEDTFKPDMEVQTETQTQQASTFIGEKSEPQPQEERPDSPANKPQKEQEDTQMLDTSPPSTLDEDLNIMTLNTRPASPSIVNDPTTLWQKYASSTHALSQSLTEQLRLILEPTLATKLRGDFRTGKRLNIKRIIPYIASGYKRDKIWMRRSVPSKRAYQVMLAIDDSGSMAERAANIHSHRVRGIVANESTPELPTPTRADLALSTLALVTASLTSLEIPSISVLGFGAEPFIAHPFNLPFASSTSGPSILSQFSFTQRRTDVRKLVETAINEFKEARASSSATSGSADLWQLMLIIGDGICEDHEGIRRELVKAREERILVVFVVVDDVAPVFLPTSSVAARAAGAAGARSSSARGNVPKQGTSQSIVDLVNVEFVSASASGDDGDGSGDMGGGDMKIVKKKYLETFPFEYYLIVRDVTELPGVLAAALRQWFAEVAERR